MYILLLTLHWTQSNFPNVIIDCGYDSYYNTEHEYRDALQPWLQRPCDFLLRGRGSVPDVLIPLFVLTSFSAS
jgi:hypothetical protein